MADVFTVGNEVRLSCAFTVNDVATDPTTVTLQVTDPSGNVDTYTYALAQLTKSVTGAYYKDVSVDEFGFWKYRWVGTGTCAAAVEGSWWGMTEF